MANDFNRFVDQAGARSRQVADENMKRMQDMRPLPPGRTGGRPGSLLGFVIVVAVIVLVALWIASMQS